MTCRACRERPVTGVIFALCDECFVAFEQKIEREKRPTDGKYVPTDAEVETINEPFVDRSRN